MEESYALAGAFPSANKNPAQDGRMLVFKLGGEEMSPPVQSIAKVNPVVPSMTTDASLLHEASMNIMNIASFVMVHELSVVEFFLT